MEIKLSDSDMDRLAGILERKISDRIMGVFMNNALYSEMTDRAKRFAFDFIEQENFDHTAIVTMQKHFAAEGSKKLEQIVKDAVAQINHDDPELRKMVRKEMYEALKQHAELMVRRMQEMNDDYE